MGLGLHLVFVFQIKRASSLKAEDMGNTKDTQTSPGYTTRQEQSKG